MNSSKIYATISGRHDKPKSPEQIEEALKKSKESSDVAFNEGINRQNHLDWMTNEVTVKMFKELGTRKKDLMEEAVTLSTTYHQHQNHLQIIKRLQEVATINEILNKYASAS